MKIKVINGVNMNMLGIREPKIYGSDTYNDLVDFIKKQSESLNVELSFFQSNYEGAIVEEIQRSYFEKIDGIVINPGAYTHTSIAILDALKSVNIPAVEVHMSDINYREEFRKISYVSLYCYDRIVGKGKIGYIEAIKSLIKRNNLEK